MKNYSKYEEKEKRYHVSKKRRLNYKVWFSFFILPSIVSLFFGTFCIIDSLSTKHNKNNISYIEKGKADYKVYLKENNYYSEKFLPSNMQYVASLINTVNVNFKYENHATNEMDYKYNYEIVATLVITDKNDSKKVLYEKPFVLLEKMTKNITDNDFVIMENIDIDYEKYNNYVNAYKKEYALTVNSNLIVKMNIETEGKSDLTSKKMNTNNELQVKIPLSEQTIDITMDSNDINKTKTLPVAKTMETGNLVLLISGIILVILAFVLITMAIYFYLSLKSKKDIYQRTVEKYLKEYDRLIVTTKQPNIDEANYEVIRILTFNDLLDTQEMVKQPILYYEVIPQEKSYFVIKNEKKLYKFTISKAWLQKNGGDRK